MRLVVLVLVLFGLFLVSCVVSYRLASSDQVSGPVPTPAPAPVPHDRVARPDGPIGLLAYTDYDGIVHHLDAREVLDISEIPPHQGYGNFHYDKVTEIMTRAGRRIQAKEPVDVILARYNAIIGSRAGTAVRGVH